MSYRLAYSSYAGVTYIVQLAQQVLELVLDKIRYHTATLSCIKDILIRMILIRRTNCSPTQLYCITHTNYISIVYAYLLCMLIYCVCLSTLSTVYAYLPCMFIYCTCLLLYMLIYYVCLSTVYALHAYLLIYLIYCMCLSTAYAYLWYTEYTYPLYLCKMRAHTHPN